MDLQDQGRATDSRDWPDVANEIEFEILIKRGVTGIRKTDQQKGVSVGRRVHDGLGRDIAATTRTVLDDEWLAESHREPLPHQARHDVEVAGGSESDNDAHRPRWVDLRPREGRPKWQCGGTRSLVGGIVSSRPPVRLTHP